MKYLTKYLTKENLKKAGKYTVNGLSIAGALVIGFNAIEGINIPYANQIVQCIAVINGVIGTYLIGTKTQKEIEKGFTDDDLK